MGGNVSFRIEKDALGQREVPANAYYGIQALRAAQNFPITGDKIHRELIIALAMIKKCAALVNMELGYLHPDLGKPISMAAQEMIDGKLHDQVIVDPIQGGAGTSFNMNINEIIANRALEIMGKEKGDYFQLSPNTHVNMSQSTNDVFPTAVRIATIRLIQQLLAVMGTMHQAFKSKAEEFDSVLKMGRTHLQDAVPIRLGQEFAAYSRVISRDIARIRQSCDHLYVVNIGATAIGTGLNADPRYATKMVELLSEISGLSLSMASDLVDATQNTDAYTEVSSTLKICMLNMSKIANDLRLLASGPQNGLNEILLPPMQPGSSIMPGKVNPVMCEMINQVAFQVMGNDHTICAASEAGQLELNVMEPVLVYNLLQSIEIMKNAFEVFTKNCIHGIQANEKRCQEYVEQSVGVITAINPHIGYETAARIAKECVQSGKSVRELCLLYDILSEEELNQILDPYEMTKPGISGRELLGNKKEK